jgi:AcrR family transcriptional regulator
LFQALVRDMSAQVRDTVGPVLGEGSDALDSERRALEAFLRFAREHRDIYRIIDESEFVEPCAYREHYETTATRIAARLKTARGKGEIDGGYSDEDLDVLAWAMMGANVFLGLRFAVWDDADEAGVAGAMSRVWRRGFGK